MAWKFEKGAESKVCFAADTCVTFGDRQMELGGVKILEVPLRYSAPAEQGSNKRETWTRTYGLAFSGNYVAAFLVKELVGEILSNLQGIGGEEMTEFGRLCELVGKFHEHFFTELEKAAKYPQDIDFFFGGFCPVAKKVRVARFFIDPQARRARCAEILQKTGESFETFGNDGARQRFHELINLSLTGDPCRVHFAAFRRLRDVIQSGHYHGVAGAIQYGDFDENGNFRLYGTGMLQMGPFGPAMKTFIRGTDLDGIHQAKMPHDYLIGCASVLPFNEDIGQFEGGASHYTADGKRVMLDELITVLPDDPCWRAIFMAERRRLRLTLRTTAVIEHIGSTAVPGLPAVPAVDILVGLRSSEISSARLQALARLGYEQLGIDRSGAVQLFRKRGNQSFNLFVVARDNDFWRCGIVLRDYLCTHPEVASDYGREKLRILNRGGWVLYRYNREKSCKLDEILARALHELKTSSPQKMPIRGRMADFLRWCRSWAPMTPPGRL